MDLETIFYSVIIGTIVLIIGGWTLIYYATLQHDNYHGYDDERPEFTEEEKKELSLLAKNQDKDVPL